MTLKSLLTFLGFEYDELWPASRGEQLHDRAERLHRRLQRCYARLVRRRCRIETLRQRIDDRSQQADSLACDMLRARLERQELLYQADLAEVERVRQRLLRGAGQSGPAAARTEPEKRERRPADA